MVRRLKEGPRNKLLMAGALLGIIGCVLAVVALVKVSGLDAKVPRKPTLQNENLNFSRVEDYAKNYFQVWAMGTPETSATFDSFYKTTPLRDFNADPVQITDLNVADIHVAPTKQGEVLWTVTLGATMKAPGLGDPTRNFYDVSIVQQGESLTAANLPHIVDLQRPTIQAGNAYSTAVPVDSPLYQVAVNFASTYLTPQNAESFGRYVTADYEGSPLSSSPYSAANVTAVYAPSNTVIDQVKAGEKLPVMVRVKASTSQATYQTMDLNITAVKQPNGQWLVDSLDDAPQTAKSETTR